MTAPVRQLAVWQTQPCQPWCVAQHDDSDGPAARRCFSVDRSTTLSLEETLRGLTSGGGSWFAEMLTLALETKGQGMLPYISLHRASDAKPFDLTLDEAAEIAAHLTALVEEGRS